MTITEKRLCVKCSKPVLGCSECDDCDANRYCPGHYFFRAKQQGRLHGEGTLFADLNNASDEDEFVRRLDRTISRV